MNGIQYEKTERTYERNKHTYTHIADGQWHVG